MSMDFIVEILGSLAIGSLEIFLGNHVAEFYGLLDPDAVSGRWLNQRRIDFREAL